MFDLSQLRCFVAVAEELHFGRAAARLNMTQPPLSRQIQVLERILDAQLLDRTSRSVRLTAAGRSFLPEASRILRLSAIAAQTTRQVAAGRAGLLKLGFTAASAYDVLPRLVAACRASLPDVSLSLREMVTRDQIEGLLSGQIDAGLIRPPVAHPDLDAEPALEEPLVAALPAAHPLAERPHVSLIDFDDRPFIAYAPYEAGYFDRLVSDLFVAAGIRPRVEQHLAQIHSILALVRAGLGLALVPASAQRLRFEEVAFRPLHPPPPRPVELLLAWKSEPDNPLLAGLRTLVRTLDRP